MMERMVFLVWSIQLHLEQCFQQKQVLAFSSCSVQRLLGVNPDFQAQASVWFRNQDLLYTKFLQGAIFENIMFLEKVSHLFYFFLS